MYRKATYNKTTILRTTSTVGETIEQKMARIIYNNEPITDGAPLIYTDYKDDVEPQYDVRTDKMDVAMMSKDKVSRQELARRKDLLNDLKEPENQEQKNGETPANSGTTD